MRQSLPPLSLDYLKTFAIFVESKNINEAAHRLRMSQPGVSVHLKKLEEGLPHPLFSLQGKKKVLTHYGRSVYTEVRKQLDGLSHGLERVNRFYSSPENINLKVGVRIELLSRVVSTLRVPRSIEFLNLSNEDSIAKLLAHEIDIAITHQKPDLTYILAQKLFANTVKLCVHEDLLNGSPLTLAHARKREFLSTTPLVAYKRTPPFLADWLAYSGCPDVEPHIRVVCEDWNAIMTLIENGVGFSIVPTDVVSRGKKVRALEVPANVIPAVPFFALYHADLKKLPGVIDSLFVRPTIAG